MWLCGSNARLLYADNHLINLIDETIILEEMRRIILDIAVTPDGSIEGPNGETD